MNASLHISHDAPPNFPDRAEIELLLSISLFSPDDEAALRKAWRILKEQTDDYLDMVLGMAAAHPTLATALFTLHGNEGIAPIADIRTGFRRWLFETCSFPQEPPWLKQLYSAQSLGDSAMRSIGIILPNFRYAVALAYPLVATAHSFLAVVEQNHQEIERIQYALLKAVLLQINLLSKLYIKEALW